jgi:hybrid polyketide synthase/nonribosomal peptide synthetase ACE1
MLSSTGKSRMWDVDADGYARGEGFAAVLLKPLSKALADGDAIESVIRETGVGQDGRSVGLTVSSEAVQAELVKSTYVSRGVLRPPCCRRSRTLDARQTVGIAIVNAEGMEQGIIS